MFERFADASRRVVVLAQDETRILNHGVIGPEHLMLGVLHQGESSAARLLADAGVALEAVRDTMEPGREQPSGPIPFTPAAKAALETAFRTAQRGATQVQPAHLLLGALGQDRARRALEAVGADVERLRQALVAEVGEPPGVVPRFAEAHPTRRMMRKQAVQPETAVIHGVELLDRLSDGVLLGLAVARREAQRLGRPAVGPELLVLGLLAADGDARDTLVAAGASEVTARATLEAFYPPVEAPGVQPVPLDAAARWLVEHTDGGTADLLRALLCAAPGTALLLAAAGADPAVLRDLQSGTGEGDG